MSLSILMVRFPSLSFDLLQAPAPSPAKAPEKPSKKAGSKEPAKKGKEVEPANETPLDPVAEKLRQQRLVSGLYYDIQLVRTQVNHQLIFYLPLLMAGIYIVDTLKDPTDEQTSD